MAVNERQIWMGAGFVILIFLVITTPGWKEVLGVNLDLGFLGRYAPALILLGFMAALVGFVLVGGDNEGGGE
ncbi:MAG: hypothetical protein GOV01_01205 [Candidatus Altiarchaeota archaeon]|nr:hypothetical protein [Candidatus Altiarchaeota archaeon]